MPDSLTNSLSNSLLDPTALRTALTDAHAAGHRLALVTGGSSGIGAATAQALTADGWFVVCAARRQAELRTVVAEINAAHPSHAVATLLDITVAEQVASVAAAFPQLHLLVNNAGGALGLDPVATGDLAQWRWMYETNVLGTLQVTQALLPTLLQSEGHIINIGSIAARVPYVGGAGYNAAKHGVAALTRVLRLEHVGDPIRICEIDPGRVETDFSLVRFGGDAQRAAAVYADKLNLQAADIAEAVRWVASLPAHVNIDQLQIMPRDQVV